jgi:hypothetical protein
MTPEFCNLQVVADYLEQMYRYIICAIRQEVGGVKGLAATRPDSIQWQVIRPCVWCPLDLRLYANVSCNMIISSCSGSFKTIC